jgi:hypothetical protein
MYRVIFLYGDVAGQMCNFKKSLYKYKLLIQVSQKWRTNGELRFRRDYRKREQKNVRKNLFNFVDLGVFESGT